MADKSSTSNTENYLERAFNNTSGAAIPAAAKDSTKKFKDIHRHKRQKAMNWQGLREWQAASTRSNNLIVGTDGIVRPVSGGVVASNGSSSKGDGGGSGDNNDSTGTGTGTGTDTDTGGEKLDPFTGSTRHSSLLPKSELIPSTRSAQKRKIDWSEEDPDNAVADDIIGLTASDIPIVTSTRNRGSFNARSNTTIAQRSNRTNSYANVHPSRIGNLDPGRARPYTNGEQEELQHRFLKNESTACEELKGKVTDDISSVDLGNYAPSLAFSGSEYNSTYEEHGHSPNSNLADITAREASLCRREVLLDISEQSVMNTRTQILQSIKQALTASTEARDSLKCSHSNLSSNDRWLASPSSAGNHCAEFYTQSVTGSIEETVDALIHFEDSLIGVERVLVGQHDPRE